MVERAKNDRTSKCLRQSLAVLETASGGLLVMRDHTTRALPVQAAYSMHNKMCASRRASCSFKYRFAKDDKGHLLSLARPERHSNMANRGVKNSHAKLLGEIKQREKNVWRASAAKTGRPKVGRTRFHSFRFGRPS